MEIKLHFGSLAMSLEKQLNEHGLTLGEQAKRYHEINDSLTKLLFFGLVTPSELEKFRKKLFKKILKEAKPLEVKE